jgi:hypothetical protein
MKMSIFQDIETTLDLLDTDAMFTGFLLNSQKTCHSFTLAPHNQPVNGQVLYRVRQANFLFWIWNAIWKRKLACRTLYEYIHIKKEVSLPHPVLVRGLMLHPTSPQEAAKHYWWYMTQTCTPFSSKVS